MKPSNVDTGRVVGRFIVDIVDGADEDDEPDFIAAKGAIEFVASVKYLPNPTAEPAPVTILRSVITGIIDDEGYVCTPDPTDPRKAGRRGVRLVANNDPDLLVQNWTWHVRYRFEAINGVEPEIESHDIDLGSNETLDLTTAVSVPSSPGIGVPQIEATALRAEAAAKGVVDRANAGEFKGDTGPATDLSIGIMEFIPGSAIDSEVVDAQLSTAGTVANIALIAEAKRAVLANAGSVLASNFKLGTITTNPAGSNATASLTGTAPEKTLNLGLPKGDPGGLIPGPFLNGSLNGYTTTGFYRNGDVTQATIANNFPREGVPGVLTVRERYEGGSQVLQTYETASTTPTVYRRLLSSGAWSPRRTYASTRVDNTAGRVIYQWDDTSGREQRIYSDTGWRGVELGPNVLTARRDVRWRRLGDTVHLRIVGVDMLPGTGMGELVTSKEIPSGFKPVPGMNFHYLGRSNSAAEPYQLAVYGPVYWSHGDARPTSGPLAGNLTWQTDDPWPTSLPGGAIGAIPHL